MNLMPDLTLDAARPAHELLTEIVDTMATATRLFSNDDFERLEIDPDACNHRELVYGWLSAWAPRMAVGRWDLHVGRWNLETTDDDAIGRVARLIIRWDAPGGEIVFDTHLDLGGQVESAGVATPTDRIQSTDSAVRDVVTGFTVALLPYYQF